MMRDARCAISPLAALLLRPSAPLQSVKHTDRTKKHSIVLPSVHYFADIGVFDRA